MQGGIKFKSKRARDINKREGVVEEFFSFVDITKLDSLLRFVERIKNNFESRPINKADYAYFKKDIKDFMDVSRQILIFSEEPTILLKTLEVLSLLAKKSLNKSLHSELNDLAKLANDELTRILKK